MGGPKKTAHGPAPALVGAALLAGLCATSCGGPGRAATRSTQPPVSTTSAPPTSTAPASLFRASLFSKGGVQSWPLLPSSARFASDVTQDYTQAYGAVGVNTMPIYSVPASQPAVAMSVLPGCNSFLADTGREVPVPAYASLNGSSDDPLIVYQPSSGSDWELWRVTKAPGGTYSACWGGRLDMETSSGVFPWPYGMSATGISYLATTITEADVASGQIEHTIALQLPRCNGAVYPADRHDCGASPDQPAEGQWFRLPAGLPMPGGLTPFAQMVFRALQRYGAVVVDYAGAVMIEAEQQSDWAAEGHGGVDPITASWQGEPEYKVVADIPWSSLQAIDPPKP